MTDITVHWYPARGVFNVAVVIDNGITIRSFRLSHENETNAKRIAFETATALAPPGYPEMQPGCDVYRISDRVLEEYRALAAVRFSQHDSGDEDRT